MKNKKKKKRRIRFSKGKAVFLLLILLGYFGIQAFNQFMEPRLVALAKQHVSIAINNIAKEVLKEMEYDNNAFIQPLLDEHGSVVSINYDSYQLNQILYDALNIIDESLLAAQDGKEDPITHEVFYEHGIFYNIPVWSLTGIPFLSNLGPDLPLKMKLINDVTGEVVITSEAYGINNTMIKISLKISIEAQAVTVLNVSDIQTTTEIPLVMQLVNGKVPSYLPIGLNEEK